MGWFRRTPKGRHALGAAVTSIPSGPVAPAVAVPVAPVAAAPVVLMPVVATPVPPPPVVAAPAVAEPVPAEPVARLVQELLVAPPTARVEPVVPVASVPAQALPPLDLMVGDAPPLEAPVVVPAQAVAPPPVPVADAPAAPLSTPPGPRVELGFADGSVRMLDPTSPAAQALSDLVGELTGKDAVTGQGHVAIRR